MSETRSEELRDRSTGELLKQLSQETSTLVRQELELARAELKEQGRRAGAGAGLFGGAGAMGLVTLGALTAFLIAVLDTGMPLWVAALIVAVVEAAVTGVLAMSGRNRIKEATPPAPQTVDTVKEDLRWAKTRKPSASR